MKWINKNPEVRLAELADRLQEADKLTDWVRDMERRECLLPWRLCYRQGVTHKCRSFWRLIRKVCFPHAYILLSDVFALIFCRRTFTGSCSCFVPCIVYFWSCKFILVFVTTIFLHLLLLTFIFMWFIHEVCNFFYYHVILLLKGRSPEPLCNLSMVPPSGSHLCGLLMFPLGATAHP